MWFLIESSYESFGRGSLDDARRVCEAMPYWIEAKNARGASQKAARLAKGACRKIPDNYCISVVVASDGLPTPEACRDEMHNRLFVPARHLPKTDSQPVITFGDQP